MQEELYFFFQVLVPKYIKIKAFLISDFGSYLWGINCGLQSVSKGFYLTSVVEKKPQNLVELVVIEKVIIVY